MWAMIVKEFRQLRRDRRTLAMMIVMPVVLLIVFGYAASFDVTTIPAVAAGPQASQAAHIIGKPFELVGVQPSEDRAWAERQLRDGHAAVAVVTGNGRPEGADRRQSAVHRQGDDRVPVRHRGQGRGLWCGSRRRPGDPAQHGRCCAKGHGALQPRPDHLGHHDPRPGRRGARLRRHDHHQPRGGP